MNEFFQSMRDLLARLTFKGTWIRVGAFVLGIALLAVGLNILVGRQTVQVVEKVAGTIGEVV